MALSPSLNLCDCVVNNMHNILVHGDVYVIRCHGYSDAWLTYCITNNRLWSFQVYFNISLSCPKELLVIIPSELPESGQAHTKQSKDWGFCTASLTSLTLDRDHLIAIMDCRNDYPLDSWRKLVTMVEVKISTALKLRDLVVMIKVNKHMGQG